MKRIGQAKSKTPRGSDNRIYHYGVYDTGIAIYEGYEHIRDGQVWLVGLALGGPNAAHLQPHLQLSEILGSVNVTYFSI